MAPKKGVEEEASEVELGNKPNPNPKLRLLSRNKKRLIEGDLFLGYLCEGFYEILRRRIDACMVLGRFKQRMIVRQNWTRKIDHESR